MDMAIIGTNIKYWREQREMGLNELARRAGMHRGTLSKIEAGIQGASLETLAKLASALKVPLAFLVKEDTNVGEVQEGTRKIRVLDWVQAGSWAGVAPAFRGDEMQEYVSFNIAASSETFALRVRGDSMEPGFSEGDIIVVDPLRRPRPGSYVVAKDAKGEATFKQYRDLGIDAQGRNIFELRPLNELYPPRRSDREEMTIVGTVVSHRRDLE